MEDREKDEEETEPPDADGDDADGDDADASDNDGKDTSDSSDDSSDSGDGMKPANEITAPSIGPNTVIEKESPQGRLASGKASDTDAMGLDKRREVMGGSYSASFGRQAALYGAVLGVLAALTIGFILLANKLDAPPEKYADEAPWTNSTKAPVQPQ